MNGESQFRTLFCKNYINDEISEKLNIGYSHQSWPFFTLPTLALLLNIFIIVTHIRRAVQRK